MCGREVCPWVRITEWEDAMAALIALILAALTAPAAADAIVGDINAQVTADALVYSNEAVELSFSTETGAWTRLVDKASGCELIGPSVTSDPVGDRAGWFLSGSRAPWRTKGYTSLHCLATHIKHYDRSPCHQKRCSRHILTCQHSLRHTQLLR